MRIRQLVTRTLPRFNEVELVRRVLPGPGVMLDVGAHFGSSALPFVKAGWEVHAFEPDPANRSRLETRISDADNVTIVPAAVSNERGTMTLFGSDVSSGISSLTPFHGSHAPIADVEVTTLSDYVETKNLDRIDFLKIDSEGYDLFVLQGVPWRMVRPAAIVCEFEDRKTIPLGYDFDDLARFLVDQGYEVLVSEWYPVVEYGANHEWRQLRRYPHRLADDAAWGNLVALPDRLLQPFERHAAFAALRHRARSWVARNLTSDG